MSEKGKICPYCGHRAAQRAKTCLMCGAPLRRWYLRPQLLVSGTSLFLALLLMALIALLIYRFWPQSGEHLALVPTPVSPTPTARMAVPTPSPVLSPSPVPFTEAITYLVQPGESLASIAERHNTTVAAILAANAISNPSLLYPGQEIIIPVAPPPTPKPVVYLVQPGDNLFAIASRFGTTVEDIIAANDLSDPGMIRVGQSLIIPYPGPVGGSSFARASSPSETDIITHVVQPGDTLFDIAVQYGASLEVIMTANQISLPQFLQVGQVLVIPLGTPTPVPTPTPTPTFTPTPGPPYQAPAPLYPPDRLVIRGSVPVVLNWASVGLLAEDEWYVLRVRYLNPGERAPHRLPLVWTKATSWRLPGELRPPVEAAPRLFMWDVAVVHHPGADLPRWEISPDELLSAPGTTRYFYWY